MTTYFPTLENSHEFLQKGRISIHAEVIDILPFVKLYEFYN